MPGAELPVDSIKDDTQAIAQNDEMVEDKEDGDEDVDEEEDDEGEKENEDADAEPVESLVAGRERRKTAGSRYHQLLSAHMREDADDEVALLFAEEGEDEEFEDPDIAAAEAEAEEVNGDDSSTDEEDPADVEEDELAGEKQLAKEERAAKRAQKRKAVQSFNKAPPPRKKVKIDEHVNLKRSGPSTLASIKAPERTRKRSERVSWIPSDVDAPVRTSSRTLSVQNKERTLESMKESEARRVRQVHIMEKAQKRREAQREQIKTQVERLEEAAKIERQNSRSLNKWEEMEKERMARQKARLEALHNRVLEGPVIRWYSGLAEWADGKLTHVGKRVKVEEVVEMPQEGVEEARLDALPSRKKRSLTTPRREGTVKFEGSVPLGDIEAEVSNTHGAGFPKSSDNANKDGRMPEVDVSVERRTHATEPPATVAEQGPDPTLGWGIDAPTEARGTTGLLQRTPLPDAKEGHHNLLDGLEYYASLDEEQKPAAAAQAQVEEDVRMINAPHEEDSIPSGKVQIEAPNSKPPLSLDPSASALHSLSHGNDPQSAVSPLTISQGKTIANTDEEPVTRPRVDVESTSTAVPLVPQLATNTSPPPPKIVEHSTRNLLTLHNFNTTTTSQKDVLRCILFGWPSASRLPNTASSNINSYASLSTSNPNASSISTTSSSGRRSKAQDSAYSVQKPVQPTCVITGQVAKYIDPLTGLPYKGIAEFKSLRHLSGQAAASPTFDQQAGPTWSSLLGAWVGAGGRRGQATVPTTSSLGGVLQTPAVGSTGISAPESVDVVRWRAARGVSEGFVGGKVEVKLTAAKPTSAIGPPSGPAGASVSVKTGALEAGGMTGVVLPIANSAIAPKVCDALSASSTSESTSSNSQAQVQFNNGVKAESSAAMTT